MVTGNEKHNILQTVTKIELSKFFEYINFNVPKYFRFLVIYPTTPHRFPCETFEDVKV
jgi:hypothetical protein